jgi:biopolymer transport protein ExbD
MTPMIDVTFLLLIFFMTVNQVSAVNQEMLDLPKQKGSLDQQEAHLTININRQGGIIVSAELRTLAELGVLIHNAIASVDGDAAQVKVTIRADRRAKCRALNEVIGALNRQGVRAIRISVESGA